MNDEAEREDDGGGELGRRPDILGPGGAEDVGGDEDRPEEGDDGDTRRERPRRDKGGEPAEEAGEGERSRSRVPLLRVAAELPLETDGETESRRDGETGGGVDGRHRRPAPVRRPGAPRRRR